ncbi:hypothetical protein O3M35_007904 [Rhynocoris fuscipes]|uniref:Odorant receptor n=1 Tax=Rhynocoris fuscipes TaxID=488301 RepID=A0AAW1DDN0_9HEMI
MILSGVKILKDTWLKRLLNHVYLSVLGVTLLVLIGLAIWTVLVASYDVSLTLEAAQFIVSLLIIALGLLNALYHSEHLNIAAKEIDNGIFSYENENVNEVEEIKRHGVQQITIMSKIFTVYIIFSGISYLLFIPLKELIKPSSELERPINKLLPLPLYMPFQTETCSTYMIAFAINIICMYCIIVLILSIDEVYISLIIQIRIQFQILNQSIANLNLRAIRRIKFQNLTKQQLDNEEFKRNVYICLKENIRHHLILLRFSELVEPYLGTTFLIIVALSSLIIAATGYLTVQYNSTTEQLLKFCIVLLSELLFVLHFCWFGEEVHTEIVSRSYTYLNLLRQKKQ